MRPEKKPAADLLIITPVWGAYDMVKRCVEHLDKNTDRSFYHVLLDDNYPDDPLTNHVKPSENRAIIRVDNDPPGYQHVEQIAKMMDLGLAFGRNFVSWNHFVKLESDCLVQPHWDSALLQAASTIPKWCTMEATSVDVTEDMTEDQIQAKIQDQAGEPWVRGKDWNEMNCVLFSPEIMHYTWCFSMVPHAHDQHVSKHLQTLSGDLFNYETSLTHIRHYRSSSRKHYA